MRPNPARVTAVVALTVPESGAVEVSVYDVLGRRVAVLHEGALAAGRHEIALSTERLPPGVYVVRVTAAGTVRTQRLTRVR